MMKKIKLYILYFLCLFPLSAYSYTYEEFLEAPPQQQVEMWLEEFQGYSDFSRGVLFNRCCDYLSKNYDSCKDFIISSYVESELSNENNRNIRFSMISSILISYYRKNILSNDELNLIIYASERAIYNYILENRVIDSKIISIVTLIDLYKTGKRTNAADVNPVEIKVNYEKAGIKDIKINWDEIETRYKISRTDYVN